MKIGKIQLSIILVLTLFLTGCSSYNKIAKDLIKRNSNADFIIIHDSVYINASNISSIKDLKLTCSEKIGKVTKTYNNNLKFSNGIATKLSVGAEIYTTVERDDILIIKENNKDIIFLLFTEG